MQWVITYKIYTVYTTQLMMCIQLQSMQNLYHFGKKVVGRK